MIFIASIASRKNETNSNKIFFFKRQRQAGFVHPISTERENFALSATHFMTMDIRIKADRETSTSIAFKAKLRKPRYLGLRHVRERDTRECAESIPVLHKAIPVLHVIVSILGPARRLLAE